MRSILAGAVLFTGAILAVPAAGQDAVAGPERAPAREVYTAWGHDFELFIGTEGPVNPSTGARPCAAGPCGWAAGLHVPSGAQIVEVEFSACDGDSTSDLSFTLLRGPKVPADADLLIPFTHTGVGATPGCSTFKATLGAPEKVRNNKYSYVFVVNSDPGTNVEWNQLRAVYILP